MVCFILCPECSEDLAEIFPAYEIVKNKHCENILNKNKNSISIDKIDFKKDLLVNFEFILKALRITNMCCVQHILGNVEFESLYY